LKKVPSNGARILRSSSSRSLFLPPKNTAKYLTVLKRRQNARTLQQKLQIWR
jgi:hypothetical protein